MRPLELNILLRNLDYAERGDWERTRMMMLASIQPHSRKSLTPNDIMRFKWDDEHKEQAHEPTDEEISQINKQFEKMLNS